MTPVVRQLADHDWDGIVALEAGTYGDDGLSEPREVLRSRGKPSPRTCLVVVVDERLAGYVLSLPYPAFRYPDLARAEDVAHSAPNLHLHDLVVAPPLRGTGLATALLGRLTAVARSLEYERISLVAVSGSHTFWAGQGFLGHPEISLPGSYGAEALYMSTTI